MTLYYEDLRPDRIRAVEVSIADTWRAGELYAYRRDGERWLGYVRYSTGPGENYVGWYDQTRLRASK